MRQTNSSLRFTTGWPRWIIGLVIVLYFILALALLAFRYLVVPNVDYWRPQIEARASSALGIPVQFGEIRAGWQGWNPVLELDDVVLRNAQGDVILSIPQTQARLSWRSVLRLRPGLRLFVSRMDLTIRRDAEGAIYALGHRIQGQDDTRGEDSPWLEWLLSQPSIALRDTTIRWRDQQRAAPELVFTGVEAVLDGSKRDELAASFSMHPPAELGGAIEIRARLHEPERLARGAWPDAYQAYAAIEDLRPPAWRPWVDIPQALRDGRMTLRAWADAGAPGGPVADDPVLTAEAAIDDMDWVQSATTRFVAPRVRASVQGPWSAWRAAAGQAADATGPLRVSLQTQGLDLRNPEWFQHPIVLGQLDLDARVRPGRNLSLAFERLHWRNADIDVTASGLWHADDDAGRVDIQGVIARARLDAIHRYLPLEVDADAREWLAQGLKAGVLTDAQLRLRGDLSEFPFGDHPEAGDFLVAGRYQEAVIDYIPAEADEPAWPMLQDMAGTAELHRASLTLSAERARMQPADGAAIELSNLRASIPNIEQDAVLTVAGETQARAEDYLALIAHTPLRQLLDKVFDEARASGRWQVPLSLVVPLSHGEDTQVDGRILLENATLHLMPGMPEFRNLNGALHFTDTWIEAEPGLRVQVLGGDAAVSGRLGSGAEGLVLRGRLGADALRRFVDVPGMSRFDGAMDYEARVARDQRGYRLALESDLRGLALDFPAPLAKPASQARTLRIVWSNQEARDDLLSVDMGTDLSVRMRHRRGARAGPYFHSASIGLNRAAPPPDGLSVDMAYPLLDMDRWSDIVDEFSAEDGGKGAGTAKAMFPDLAMLNLQADELRMMGMRLDQAVLRLLRDADTDQWSMNVRSNQTTGTLKWRQKNGEVQGHVSARFARLSLGDDPRDGPSLLPETDVADLSFDEELDIPAIVLQADELRIFGHPLGVLSLEGVRDPVAGNWRLETFSLGNQHARVRGTGLWRLRGSRRGLSIKANAEAADLGAWMDTAGFRDVLAGGQGTLKGEFEWRDLPWTHRKDRLSGHLEVALDDGRFSKMGSRSAKLLELLSLQSISRLPSLDHGLTGLTEQGFPFDQLRGRLELADGIAQAHDYKVIGPVATILMEGKTSILQETLDMQAVIVPNLDVSGAAVAAGIAINPVIGIGAFLSQWLFKNPVARAMTARYRVTGTWDDPVVTEIRSGDAVTETHETPGTQPGR